jgi:hypothetical protein
MAQSTPIIAIKQDFDPDELPRIRLQQEYDDRTKEKMEVPIIDGRSVEANLYSLNEYLEAAEELSYDTGDDLFKFFCRILRGTIKDDWDSAVTDNGFANTNGKTDGNYHQCIRTWKLTFVTKDSRQTLVDFLQTVHKPRALPVETFVQRLKTLA